MEIDKKQKPRYQKPLSVTLQSVKSATGDCTSGYEDSTSCVNGFQGGSVPACTYGPSDFTACGDGGSASGWGCHNGSGATGGCGNGSSG